MTTIADFLDQLACYCGSWGWHLDKNGAIRLKRLTGEANVCPLTALVRFETGTQLDISDVTLAAQLLEMNPDDAVDIVHLADNCINTNVHDQLALLQACRIFV